MAAERLMVRLVVDAAERLVEFGLVQQTLDGTGWRTVIEIDSRHGTVHVHFHSRTSGGRTGDPKHLKTISSADDVLDGYNDVYDTMLDDWEANKSRWHDGWHGS